MSKTEPIQIDIISQISKRTNWMWRCALEMVHAKGLGHIGGNFSAIDILATLNSSVLRFRPDVPDWPERDRFIMSRGHATGALYTALCSAGYFPDA